MEGILLIDKPIGWTSFDVVAYVRKAIALAHKVKPAQVKVGHCGTLDPLASGLMVLMIGKTYTRLAGELTKLDKEYVLDMCLGEVTDSIDKETTARFYSSYVPTKDEVTQALGLFHGQLMQTPPAYSAVKVNGQRSYKLAREGKTEPLKARPVTFYNLQLKNYEYPLVSLKAEVSSGTYIRSLVLDLGNKLTTGAYLVSLRRNLVGDFNLKDSLTVDKINYDNIASHLYFV